VAGAAFAQIAELGATFRFCANSTVNWIQFLRSFSQTACHATDEVSRTVRHSSQGVVVNSLTVTAVGNLAKNPERAVKGERRTVPSMEVGSCRH
jgi:hypothetical protein